MHLCSSVTILSRQPASGHLYACYVSVPVSMSNPHLQNLVLIMYKRGHRLGMYCQFEDMIPDIWSSLRAQTE